jgi:large subunit ribosomal protein L21
MYAIIRTGSKQYRVQQGQSLLVERLPVADGDTVVLEPLLFVDGSEVVDGEGLAGIKVEARVVAHERGPKLRVVKFKPKRGYKRRTGHRQELTRLEVVAIRLSGGRGRGASRAGEAPAPVAAETAPAAEKAQEAPVAAPEAEAPEAKPRAPRKPPARTPKAETAKPKPRRTTKPKAKPADTATTSEETAPTPEEEAGNGT